MHDSKTCFKCQKTLPRSEFYRHSKMGDGLLGKCKECAKIDTKINRRNHMEFYREYDKTRAKQFHRKKLKAKITKNRRKIVDGYQAAHNAVIRAIKNGVLVKQPCQMCGSKSFIHAHHDDYSKPLEVMWLCAEHHKARHAFLSWFEF